MSATGETREDETGGQLVIIGSSAGGIEALTTVIGSLPVDFSASIVIAQHLDPNRVSHLQQILANRTSLPVRVAADQEPFHPGTIYVVPPDRDVEITDDHLTVFQQTTGRSRPSIDRLLATAARVFSDRLIAVILTGAGADGAAGAQAVKAYGGTVVVQNPETARFSGMPESVPPAVVDIVANLEAIGPLLTDLLSGAYALRLDEHNNEIRTFLDRLRERTGLDFNAYKRTTIERRLQRRMAAVGTSTLADYRRNIERHPEEMQRLVASFLIKVTAFFRDDELFDVLRERVLPELIAQARERGELRIWSAGCATGEEAYSVAMIVADLLGDDAKSLPVRIFATDVATDAIEFARRGVYPMAALEGVPNETVKRHFVPLDGALEVSKLVRGMVVFGEHDLGYRAPFPRIDLVLCRNVLIYFTVELQRRALQLFAFSLRRGGYLALGKAETVNPLPEFFTLDQPRIKLFQRVGEAASIPTGRLMELMPVSPLSSRNPRRLSAGRLTTPFSTPPPIVQTRQLLDDLTVGAVTVDHAYDIRFINGAARQLLGIRSSAHGEDLVHLVEATIAGPLRQAIDVALSGKTATIEQRMSRDVVNGNGRDLLITCSPLGVDTSADLHQHVLIEIIDITAQMRRQRELQSEADILRKQQEELRERTVVAVAEVQELRAANRSIASEQGRLRADNDQLQLINEEAQAAAEEIETLNEELQATNEELETLNEELQATVEELTTTNDELEARTLELHKQARTIEEQQRAGESERNRLSAVLSSMGDAVLVVDAAGEIILTNLAYDRLFGAGGRFVPETEEGQLLPEEDWPQTRAARGESFNLPFTISRPNTERLWLEANAQPIRGDNDTPWGIIVFRDTTDRSLRRMQEQFLISAAHELRTPLTALSGSLQLLNRRLRVGNLDERIDRLLNAAIEQSRRLDAYVGELVDVARVHGGKLHLDRAPVDLTATVSSAIAIVQATAPEQRITLDAAPEPLLVKGDGRRLEQIVLNLLSNAVKHGSSGERIMVRVYPEQEAAVLEVEDQGEGIGPEELPYLFDQFFQGTDRIPGREGLGLGLFIVKELVTAHAGTIDVRSVVGKGSVFTVRLPRLSSSPPPDGTDLAEPVNQPSADLLADGEPRS